MAATRRGSRGRRRRTRVEFDADEVEDRLQSVRGRSATSGRRPGLWRYRNRSVIRLRRVWSGVGRVRAPAVDQTRPHPVPDEIAGQQDPDKADHDGDGGMAAPSRDDYRDSERRAGDGNRDRSAPSTGMHGAVPLPTGLGAAFFPWIRVCTPGTATVPQRHDGSMTPSTAGQEAAWPAAVADPEPQAAVAFGDVRTRNETNIQPLHVGSSAEG
jgi:hypothetical protein